VVVSVDRGDELDTGSTHASAKEMRVKMKSRQAVYVLQPLPPHQGGHS
jgi:hypothetical protein